MPVLTLDRRTIPVSFSTLGNALSHRFLFGPLTETTHSSSALPYGSLLTSSARLTEKFVTAGLSYGANGAVQIGTGNIGDKFDYLSFMMSGLTGVGTAGKGYYANQLLGAGSAYMSSQIEGQDSTASVR